jgi:hypothetical protein
MLTVAVMNQKGGVGKTTVTLWGSSSPVPHRSVVTEAIGACAPVHDYGKAAEAVTEVLDAHAATPFAFKPRRRQPAGKGA